MRVIGECQTIVPDVGGGVHGFGHGANGQGLDECLTIGALATVQQLVDVLVLYAAFGRGAQVETKLTNEITQFDYFLGVGHIVHAIDKGSFVFNFFASRLSPIISHLFRHNPIGEQHKLLYQVVGIGGLVKDHIGGVACLIEVEAHFGCLKVDGSALKALAAQLFCQSI